MLGVFKREPSLGLSPATIRTVRKVVRQLGKCASAADSFMKERRRRWDKEPELREQYGNSFDFYVLNELNEARRVARQWADQNTPEPVRDWHTHYSSGPVHEPFWKRN